MLGKAIFWDFHGTLANPINGGWTQTVYDTLLNNGIAAGFDDVWAHMRSGFSWHVPEKEYPDRTGELWWKDTFAHFDALYSRYGIPDAKCAEINTYIRSHMLNPQNYMLYPDAVSTLRKCREYGFTSYVLSNNYPELELIIDGLGISGLFDGFIVSALCGYEKPHPKIFELALEAAGNPEICFMIGDNPIADMEGGKTAGMRTILVHSEVSSDCADYVCRELRDVMTIIQQY